MSRRTVEIDGRTLTLAVDDPPPPAGDRWWALAQARVLDELTGLPPAVAARVELDRPPAGRAVPRVSDGGVVGVAGVPRQAYPALASQPEAARFGVSVDGFLPRRVRVTVPQNAAFPATFSTPASVDVPLRRRPTAIFGRVVRQAGGAWVPAPGATVEVTRIWRAYPPATSGSPGDPPNLVSVHPPLYADRPAMTGQVRRRNLPVAGTAKVLVDASPRQADRVRLSDAVGVAPGSLLLIDSDDRELGEYADVLAVAGAGTADQPATVTLAFPLGRPHRPGAPVRTVAPQPPGPARQLGDAAWAGDVCLFVNNVAGLAGGEVQVTGGAGTAAESHRAAGFSATSDAAGFYRLPPLHRVAQLNVFASLGAQSAPADRFRPDYTQAESRLDFRLT